MKYICIWLIRFYQRVISPLKSRPTCRFTPSCSAYAAEAFLKRGFFVGMILTVWRIFRCQPFCAGGYDPVPEHGLKRVRMTRQDDDEADSADEPPRLICEDFVMRRDRRSLTTDRPKRR